MLSEKQKLHIKRLNDLPRNREWCINISNGKKRGKYIICKTCSKSLLERWY